MKKYIDDAGFEYLWKKLKSKFSAKADVDAFSEISNAELLTLWNQYMTNQEENTSNNGE